MAQNFTADATYKIISQGGSKPWAKSFPPGGSKPPFFWPSPLTIISPVSIRTYVDDSYIWQIQAFEEGYTIQNKGNGFKAYGKNGEVFTSNEFDANHCKWHIEGAGKNAHKIKVPNQDLVWTVKRSEPDYPLSLFLAPADGNDNQSFSFEPSVTE